MTRVAIGILGAVIVASATMTVVPGTAEAALRNAHEAWSVDHEETGGAASADGTTLLDALIVARPIAIVASPIAISRGFFGQFTASPACTGFPVRTSTSPGSHSLRTTDKALLRAIGPPGSGFVLNPEVMTWTMFAAMVMEPGPSAIC